MVDYFGLASNFGSDNLQYVLWQPHVSSAVLSVALYRTEDKFLFILLYNIIVKLQLSVRSCVTDLFCWLLYVLINGSWLYYCSTYTQGGIPIIVLSLTSNCCDKCLARVSRYSQDSIFANSRYIQFLQIVLGHSPDNLMPIAYVQPKNNTKT